MVRSLADQTIQLRLQRRVRDANKDVMAAKDVMADGKKTTADAETFTKDRAGRRGGRCVPVAAALSGSCAWAWSFAWSVELLLGRGIYVKIKSLGGVNM